MAHSIVPHSIVHIPRTVRTRLLRPDGNLLRAVSMLAGGVLGLTTLLAASSTPIVTLTRGPYLQRLTTSGVTIVWNTDVPAACSLAIRPIGGPAAVIPGETDTVCAIPVTGLAPGAQYAYVPRADGVPLAFDSAFRTDDPDRPFTFLVVGDSGTVGAHQSAVRDRMLSTPADLLLHTGDMVYPDGAAEDFDPKFFWPYRDLMRHLVFWPCLGNHDYDTDKGGPWRAAFYTPANNPAGSENYYSFDFGNAHFVVLNSNGNTAPGGPQYTFLDHDLAESTAAWKFVAFHHTIYSSGHHGSRIDIRNNLVPLFDQHGVDVVLMGHDHDYERTLPLRGDQVVEPGAGTVYVTTGGGGGESRPFETENTFTAYKEVGFHYTRVAVNGSTLLLQMIREDGAVRDSMTLVKGDPPPPPRCGDSLVNQACEECDGADHAACAGPCAGDCTCAPLCGDGLVNQATEECDGADDAACPDLCLSTCRCGDPSRFVTLAPVADTFIASGAEATWDHGASTSLTVDATPERITYLKFLLPVVTAPVARATLRLFSTNGAADAGTLYPVADSSWIEGDRPGLDASSAEGPGLKWTDVDTNGDGKIGEGDTSPYGPAFMRPIATLSAVAGSRSAVDVTAVFQAGPGLYTLAMKSHTPDAAVYSARESTSSSRRPCLRLELADPTTTLPRPEGVVLADVSVRETEPDTTFETGVLEADLSPLKRSFLRIGVSGVGGRRIAAAKLRVQVATLTGARSDSGGRLRYIRDCAWDESTMTWRTQPPLQGAGGCEGVLATAAGNAAFGSIVEFDVTPAIPGDGTYCFALDTPSTNGVAYNSREGSPERPSMVIELVP